MPETRDPIDSMFPRLDDAQIERLVPFGTRLQAQPAELLFDQGNDSHGVFVVLSGSIEIMSVSANGEAVLGTLGPGAFTGEVNQLSGRRSLVRCRSARSR